MDFRLINREDKEYPPLLREIPQPPPKIYLRGQLPSPDLPTIAIVGTRKASPAGEKIAETFAAQLARAGVTIVSGLAMGIDTAAHRGTISAGGKTVAVLGNGIDKIYPAQNLKLAKQILAGGGGIISEYGPGTPSFKWNFIERNRIISGLSRGVIVIEAPEDSGALTTAGFAAEQGKTVFVVPGPITNRLYAGSHALIRDGAVLVTKPTDVLEDLGLLSLVETIPKATAADLTEDEKKIMVALETAGIPLYVDRIIELAKLEPQQVSRLLTNLVIQGKIKEQNGQYML